MSALIYPIILATVSAVSVIILVVFVIPRFATLFETAGAALPWSTKIIMELGVMAREDWWIAALSLGGFIIVARRLLYLPVARRWVDGALLLDRAAYLLEGALEGGLRLPAKVFYRRTRTRSSPPCQ